MLRIFGNIESYEIEVSSYGEIEVSLIYCLSVPLPKLVGVISEMLWKAPLTVSFDFLIESP